MGEMDVFCWLTLTDRIWLVISFSSWERKVRLFSWELPKLHGPVVLWNAMEHVVHDGVPDDMSA